MKKLCFVLILIIVMMFTIVYSALATDVTFSKDPGQGQIITVATTTGLATADTTRTFSIAAWDSYMTDMYNGKLEVPYGILCTSAAGNVAIIVKLQGSFDNSNWYDCIAEVSGDTLETEAVVNGNMDIGDYRSPYYRFIVTGYTGTGADNNADTVVKLWFYIYWIKDKD